MSTPSQSPQHWRLLHDAVSHIQIVQPAPQVATGLLYDALKLDRVAACARSYEERRLQEQPQLSREFFIGGDFWSGIEMRHIYWHASKVVYQVESNSVSDAPFRMVMAKDIFVFWPHVLNIWPHGEEELSKVAVAVPEPVHKGRPQKYDWANAAGALAGHLHGEGIKPQAELVRFLKGWFAAAMANRIPDSRDIERFVATALSEFNKSIGEN